MTEIQDMKQFENVKNNLIASIINTAMFNIDKVDLRIGTALELAGILKRNDTEDSDPELEEIILNKLHIDRINTIPGPILFYKDSKNKNNQFAVEMQNILLNTNINLRMASWEYFYNLYNENKYIMFSGTFDELKNNREALLNDDANTWKKAAINIYDAIDNDLLCQFSGLSQSIKERYEDGLQIYLRKLLQPTKKSITRIDSFFLIPLNDQEKMITKIDLIINNASTLKELCEDYVSHCGVLPIMGAASFSNTINKWLENNDISNNEWDELSQCELASTNQKIFFYLCLFYLQEPESIPKEIHNIFVTFLLDFFDENENNKEYSKNRFFWMLNQEMARYYLRYFETHIVDVSEEVLVIISWWLAGKITEILCDDIKAGIHLREVALLPYIQNTQLEWQFINTNFSQSFTAIATHWQASLWHISMLSAISKSGINAIGMLLSESEAEKLKSGIIKHLLFWYPKKQKKSDLSYYFEIDIQNTISIWDEIESVSSKSEFLAEIAKIYNDLSNSQYFIERFKNIYDMKEADQLIIANSAKLMSLNDTLPLDQVWELLTEKKWRNKTFKHISLTVLEILFITFSWSLNRGGDKWKNELPHIYAQLCEDISDDKEKTEYLFLLTIVSCIHTYSVSAIERLLSGKMRPDLIELGYYWREYLQKLSTTASPWAVARMRAIIAAISASL